MEEETIVLLRSVSVGARYYHTNNYGGSYTYHVVKADNEMVGGWYENHKGKICGFNMKTSNFITKCAPTRTKAL